MNASAGELVNQAIITGTEPLMLLIYLYPTCCARVNTRVHSLVTRQEHWCASPAASAFLIYLQEKAVRPTELP